MSTVFDDANDDAQERQPARPVFDVELQRHFRRVHGLQARLDQVTEALKGSESGIEILATQGFDALVHAIGLEPAKLLAQRLALMTFASTVLEEQRELEAAAEAAARDEQKQSGSQSYGGDGGFDPPGDGFEPYSDWSPD